MIKKMFAGNGNPPPSKPQKQEYPVETDAGNGEPPKPDVE